MPGLSRFHKFYQIQSSLLWEKKYNVGHPQPCGRGESQGSLIPLRVTPLVSGGWQGWV